MTISKPGIYDIPAEEYHSDPAPVPSLSSSIAKMMLVDKPIHAFMAHAKLNPNYERKDEDKFDLGNAAHSLILNDIKVFAILPYDDYRKKEAQAAKEQARQDGKIPLLEKHFDRVTAMATAARLQLDQHEDASDAFLDGKPEQSGFWCEQEDGETTWFRLRLDWLHTKKTDIFYDYKSSETADPDAWQRIVYSIGHDVQAAFYRRGIKALGLSAAPRMKFVVQETSPPYALCVMELNEEAMAFADYKLEKAIRRWRWCMRHGKWPAYPQFTQDLAPPPWAEQQFLDREVRDTGTARARGLENDTEIFAQSLKWQAPNPEDF